MINVSQLFPDIENGAPITFVDQKESDEIWRIAEDSNFYTARITFGDECPKELFFRKIADALQFPDYFGHNWDAMDECLFDLGWISADHYAFFVDDATSFWRNTPELAGDFSGVWQTAALGWLREKKMFRLVFVW